jgi:alpha-mannosidase
MQHVMLQDDPSSPEYNVPDRVEAFVAAAHDWSAQMTGNDVLFMMGSDFQYANAHAWFVNLDRWAASWLSAACSWLQGVVC